MCGICGMIKGDRSPVSPDKLKLMNEQIAHRGPDGDGYYYGRGIGLAMRRLAIIDVAGGDQPIPNEDKSLWIIYNGEVYNFPELRSTLEKRGHQFRTNTDTECVLHLYEEYGVNCVDHLNGMFAFALWDEKQERLLIARDRMGQKPLYYTQMDSVFYFCSELPGLIKALPQKPEIHLSAIDQYLSYQYVPEPITPYEGVFKLPAAHRLIWEKGECRIENYWHLDYEPKHQATEADLILALRDRLKKAVQMRMISEVPLGAHLSGGIDSSIVVALMSEFSDHPVKTFSVGFEEFSFSELPYARSIAERYQTDHREFILTFEDIPADLEKIQTHIGEPFADPSALPLYHLSRLTREYVTVALNGDGGDESFAGYQRYWLDPWANLYLKLPGMVKNRLVPSLTQRLRDKADRPIGGSLINGLKRLQQLSQVDPRASILRWSSYFITNQKESLWKKEIQDLLGLGYAEIALSKTFSTAPANSFIDRTLFTDVMTYLPGDLLVKADRMTMAHSLEGRSPFLDHELAGWAARLPERYKVRGRQGKYLLRKAFKDFLPAEIMKRDKQGFGIPIGAWLRGPLVSWTSDLLLSPQSKLAEWFNIGMIEQLINEHQSQSVDHGKRLWALLALELWANK